MLKYFIFILGLFILSQPVLASSSDKDAAQIILETVFEETEKAIIEEYFGKQENVESQSKQKKVKRMPPGLAKKDSLPPGLAKRDELPPGLQGRALPEDLNQLLPSAKNGTKRVIVDKDVLLIQEGTNLILDIIEDVLP